MNISNFYLMTPLHRPEFICMKLSDILNEFIGKYKLKRESHKKQQHLHYGQTQHVRYTLIFNLDIIGQQTAWEAFKCSSCRIDSTCYVLTKHWFYMLRSHVELEIILNNNSEQKKLYLYPIMPHLQEEIIM